jgi:hypothetical protein
MYTWKVEKEKQAKRESPKSKRTYLTMFYQGKLYLFCSYKEWARWTNKHQDLCIGPNCPTPGSIRAVSRTAARMIHAEQNKQYLGFTGETVKSYLLKLRSHGRDLAVKATQERLIAESKHVEVMRVLHGGSINTMADQLQNALKRS